MMPAGRVCVLPNLYKKYLLGSDAIRLKLNALRYDSFFIIENLNRSIIRNNINSRTAGSTRQRIGLSELKKTSFYCPHLVEQKKIGFFFQEIERKIKIIERKIDILKKYKEGLCDYLFKESIHDSIHLYDLVANNPSQMLTKDIEQNVGIYPVYDATGKILKFINYYQQSSDTISIIKYGSGCGRTFISKGYHSILGTMTDLKPFDQADVLFIYAYTLSRHFASIIKKYIEIGTTPNLYFSDYSKATISNKAIKNKKIISLIIRSIEKKELLLFNEFNKLKNIKKYLLNSLFI